MKVTYDIIRVEGDVEVTEDVPQSDFDLIAEAEIIHKLDNRHASSGLFGDHLLVGEAKAKAKAKAKREIPIKLSEREERICRELDRRCAEL